MLARARYRDESGFTLIEVMVTLVVLLVGIGGAVALMDGAMQRTATTKQREGATALARELIEDARSVPYRQLTPGGVATTLQGISGLEDQDGASGWQVERRRTAYTVQMDACSIDDPQDGYGDHTAGGSGVYCASSSGTGTTDRNPDDYKRVTVNLAWKDRRSDRTLRQTAIISNESSSAGPRITSMTRNPSADPITTKTTPGIDFDVTTDRRAAGGVKFSVDGVVKFTDAPIGLDSRFDWRIFGAGPGEHVPDGTYLVTATAYDGEGRSGTPRSLTVRLNRDIPGPVQVEGGWNATRKISEIKWKQSNESDIQGYRVYLSNDGAPVQLVPGCSVGPSTTRCVDASPPASGTLVYFVVALDSDAITGLPREGDPSSPLAVVRTSDRPNPPGQLTATSVGDDVKLTWDLPVPASPSYSGDTTAFFWIYREGELVGDRFDFTGFGTDTSLTDFGAAGEGRSYWITSVDENFSESVTVGPVSVP